MHIPIVILSVAKNLGVPMPIVQEKQFRPHFVILLPIVILSVAKNLAAPIPNGL